MKIGFVYTMSNKNRTTLYIGVTNNIYRRVKEHKAGIGSFFTKKYGLIDLMYFETIQGIGKAIDRETQLKNWHSEWKWNLIKEDNPQLLDQANDWFTAEEIQLLKVNYRDRKLTPTDSETSSE